jgi:hypothetical protein
MQSFYTVGNFVLYSIGLVTAGTCVILLGDRNRRLPLMGRGFLVGLLCCSIALPLSQTCPYPGGAALLSGFAVLSALAAILFIVAGLLRLHASRNLGDLASPEADLHLYRWIMDSLRERMIIISDKGAILDWGDIAFGEKGPFPGDTLETLMGRLGDTANELELSGIFDALCKKLLPEGKTLINGRQCHYWSCRVGTASDAPVILAFVDLQEEYELLRKLGRQQAILEQRLRRLEEDQGLELSLAEDGMRRELDEVLDGKIDGILQEIEKELRRSSQIEAMETNQLDQLIKKVGDAMTRIRSHIHDMEYSRGLNPWP